uniref:Uncharacterized protein n=1 Tax=Oryza rufipogon TaxID=4529 RepID=A0A0E0Q8I3_ORYRU
MLDALKTLDDRCVGVVKEGEPLHRTNGSLHPPHPWYRTIETFTQLQFRGGGDKLTVKRGIAVAAQWTPDIEGSTATGQQEIRCRREANAGIDDGRTAWDRRRGAIQTQGRSGSTETR